MKKLFFTAALVMSSLPAYAGYPGFAGSEGEPVITGVPGLPVEVVEFQSGIIELSVDGKAPGVSCGSYTQMTLDTGALVGNFAILEDMMTPTSVCEIMIMPNQRFVKIDQVEDAGCGSARYSGELLGANLASVVITDHRSRQCKDMLVNVVVVEFTDMNTGKKQVLKTFN